MWHWSVLYCTHQYHNDKSKTSKSARFKFKDFSKKGFFKYFQAPYLFSSTFKGLEVFIPNSSIFNDFSSMLWNHLPEAVGGRWRNVDSQSADDTAQFDVQYKPSVGHFLHCTPDVPVVRCLLEVARLRDLVNKLQQLLTHRHWPTTQRQLYRHCLSQFSCREWTFALLSSDLPDDSDNIIRIIAILSTMTQVLFVSIFILRMKICFIIIRSAWWRW